MKQFNELAGEKPQGLSEGWWRVLQILRLVLSLPLVLIALGCFVGLVLSPYPYSREELFLAAISLLLSAAAIFFKGPALVAVLVRLSVWVRAGFSEPSKR